VVVPLVAGLAGFGLAGLVGGPPAPTAAVVAGPAAAVAVDRASRTPDGAVAAGVEYATLLSRLFPLDQARAHRVAADAASEGYRPVLLEAVDRQLVPLQAQAARLPGRTVYRQAVLATRVGRYSAGRASVSVWVLACQGQSGQQANPLGSFATFTLALVWQGGVWRLDGTEQRSGPTPLLDGQPVLVEEFDAVLRGFADWRPAR
jgi:hypothetical protein